MNYLFCRKIQIFNHFTVRNLDSFKVSKIKLRQSSSWLSSPLPTLCCSLWANLPISPENILICFSGEVLFFFDEVEDTQVVYFLLQLCVLDILKTNLFLTDIHSLFQIGSIKTDIQSAIIFLHIPCLDTQYDHLSLEYYPSNKRFLRKVLLL